MEPAERHELLEDVAAALRWARFGGFRRVERLAAAESAPAPLASEPVVPKSDSTPAAPAASEPAAEAASEPVVLAWPTGPADAKVCLVVAGPDDAVQAEPWAGPEGALLAKMVGAMKLSPDQIYAVALTEVAPDDVPEQRPAPLGQQLKSLRPEVLLVFGERATHLMLRTDRRIDDLRGQWRKLAGIPTMVTYGPRLLLDMPMFKAAAWKDLQDVMKRMGAS